MVNKRLMACIIFFLLVLIFWILTSFINNSTEISESSKTVFGYVTKIVIAGGFIGLIFTIIRK